MAWVRVGPERDRLVNLDGFVQINVVACDEQADAGWVVEARLRDRSSARLLEGGRAECQALLDEVAQAVWAIEVGAGADAPGASDGAPGASDPGRKPAGGPATP